MIPTFVYGKHTLPLLAGARVFRKDVQAGRPFIRERALAPAESGHATTLLRDNIIRSISGLFVFTMLFANRTLGWMGENEVHQLQVFISALFGFASVVAFLFLIDYAAKSLRPVSLVARVGKDGMAVIERVYPAPTRGAATSPERDKERPIPNRIVRQCGKSGIVLAVNMERLVAKARRTDSVIEFVPQVGDFVAVGEPLFYLYGNSGAINESRLRALVAIGTERTMEQDPSSRFAFWSISR